jgi:hypothetical protein
MFYEVAYRRNDYDTPEDLALQKVAALELQEARDKGWGQWVPVYPHSGTLTLTPAVEQRATEAGEKAPKDWEFLALAVMAKYPEWPARLVARCVGVHRGTLYRSRLFKAFRDRIRAAGKQDLLADLPRGTKEVDPDDKRAGTRLEAWSERDDDE